VEQFRPITVVETDEFLSATRKLMDDDERAELVDYLAFNPTVGDMIPGSGGVRKIRWGLEGRGKRGGARVIYFYHDMEMPLLLLKAFAKNKQDDLSQIELKKMQQFTKHMVEAHKKRRQML
jgi:hypothetical protein